VLFVENQDLISVVEFLVKLKSYRKYRMRKTCLLIFIAFLSINISSNSSEIIRKYITPTRVVWKQGEVKNSKKLLQKGIQQADLYGRGFCEMSLKSGECAVLLDFGKEIQGGVQIVTGGFSGKEAINIRLRFGESVSECMSNIGEDGATNDHALRDFNTQLPWMGKMEEGSTGFRFLRIDILDKDRTLLIKEISAISQFRDIPYLGSFESSDKKLNEIWKVGAYTVHLNMQDYLWDGIKRDRLVWVGDMHPEVMTINSVFGYNEVVPKTLDYIKGVTAPTNWMNGISSYSIWWILIQKDWFMQNGDFEYLKAQEQYLAELFKNLSTKIDYNGKEILNGTRFLDWPTSRNKETVHQGYQALMKMAFEAGVDMFQYLENSKMKNVCIESLKKMKAYKLGKASSKQASALMFLADLCSKEESVKVLLESGVKNFSTFYGYYMLEALAKAGKSDEAIELIKEYWGAMIDLGATSFWEDFNIDWMKNASRIDELPVKGKIDVHRKYGDFCYRGLRHSFCHGWASGPTAWLSNHVLGVQVLEPKFKKVKIVPNLGSLKWVKGTYPTPFGVIEIEHRRNENSEIESIINAPAGVEIVK
jgi:hypothetical protein